MASNSVNKLKAEDVIYLDRVAINETSVLFIGVAHGIDFVERSVYKVLDDFKPESVLYEEHMYDGFSPENVEEHAAIDKYTELNIDSEARSMDVPANSEHVDCLGDIVDEMDGEIPGIRVDSLSNNDDIARYNGMLESEHASLFSFTFGLRNQRMAREVMNESVDSEFERVACVVGQCHLFGSTSIRSRISNIVEDS